MCILNMALSYTKTGIVPTSTRVYVSRGPLASGSTHYGQIGTVTENPSGYNLARERKLVPFSVGTGMVVPTTGVFVFDSRTQAIGPFHKLLVSNPGATIIYAGVNSASGQIALSQGLAIESGQSYEFGGNATAPIRNAWCITATATGSVQVYGQFSNYGIP